MRAPRVKTLYAKDGHRLGLIGSRCPNFSVTGSIAGMRKHYYGERALLVRCGSYIYNVSGAPHIYEIAH